MDNKKRSWGRDVVMAAGTGVFAAKAADAVLPDDRTLEKIFFIVLACAIIIIAAMYASSRRQ